MGNIKGPQGPFLLGAINIDMITQEEINAKFAAWTGNFQNMRRVLTNDSSANKMDNWYRTYITPIYSGQQDMQRANNPLYSYIYPPRVHLGKGYSKPRAYTPGDSKNLWASVFINKVINQFEGLLELSGSQVKPSTAFDGLRVIADDVKQNGKFNITFYNQGFK